MGKKVSQTSRFFDHAMEIAKKIHFTVDPAALAKYHVINAC